MNRGTDEKIKVTVNGTDISDFAVFSDGRELSEYEQAVVGRIREITGKFPSL